MSRRLKALVRVAELKEAVARGHAAQALAATRTAEVEADARLADLNRTGLDGSSREALTASVARQLMRAELAAAARDALSDARQAQASAVGGWTDARRRHRLFTELADRAREEELTRRERAEQNVADELAAVRARRAGGGGT